VAERNYVGRKVRAAKTRREQIEALISMDEDNAWGQESWDYNGFRATSAVALALLEIADALTDIAALRAALPDPAPEAPTGRFGRCAKCGTDIDVDGGCRCPTAPEAQA